MIMSIRNFSFKYNMATIFVVIVPKPRNKAKVSAKFITVVIVYSTTAAVIDPANPRK